MRKNIVFLLCFLPLMTFAQPHYYYRFWRGFRKAEYNPGQFRKVLQDKFIPATVNFGKDHDMVAYLPALTPRIKAKSLPDEIALVVYISKEKYDAAFASKAGKAYADSHWNVFATGKSHSLVPERNAKILKLNQAYNLLEKTGAWQQGAADLVIDVRRRKEKDESYIKGLNTYIKSIAKQKGLLAELALPTKDYVLQFQSWDSRRAMQAFYSFKPPAGLFVSRRIMVAIPLHKQVRYGSVYWRKFGAKQKANN